MKADFEKARDLEPFKIKYGLHKSSDWLTFKAGADWAYEWCKEQRIHQAIRDIPEKELNKYSKIREKLGQQAKIIEELKRGLKLECYCIEPDVVLCDPCKTRRKVEEMEKVK